MYALRCRAYNFVAWKSSFIDINGITSFACTKIHQQYLSIVAGEWMRVAIKFHHGRFWYVALMFLLLNLMILVRLAPSVCMHACVLVHFLRTSSSSPSSSSSFIVYFESWSSVYIWLFIQCFNIAALLRSVWNCLLLLMQPSNYLIPFDQLSNIICTCVASIQWKYDMQCGALCAC